MIDIKRNIILPGADGKPLVFDVFSPKCSDDQKPIILYIHGFKGFKDWGHLNLLAECFAKSGYHFVKFNFSHNGVNPEELNDITDLKSFSENTYSKELIDLETLTAYIFEESHIAQQIDKTKAILMGHSRGGGIGLIFGSESNYITHIVTLASVYQLDFAWRNNPNLSEWEKAGYSYVVNSRTGQKMPVSYELCRDYLQNEERLSICERIQEHNKPVLLFHGENDDIIPSIAVNYLFENLKNAQKMIIPGMNHAMNSKHPWTENELPPFYQNLTNWIDKFTDHQ